MTDARTSLYCWLVLAVIIFGTVAFVLSFYYKTLRVISDNSATNYQLLIASHSLNQSYEEEL